MIKWWYTKRKGVSTMDYELIWWLVACAIGFGLWISVHLPWNDRYNPKGDDPYRYCPKEEE